MFDLIEFLVENPGVVLTLRCADSELFNDDHIKIEMFDKNANTKTMRIITSDEAQSAVGFFSRLHFMREELKSFNENKGDEFA